MSAAFPVVWLALVAALPVGALVVGWLACRDREARR
jgi:hypothetical protein